jgi:hypothetical protein
MLAVTGCGVNERSYFMPLQRAFLVVLAIVAEIVGDYKENPRQGTRD